MRIVCWNVNGLRAVYKKGFLEWLRQEDPDMCCLQEVKAAEEKIPPELRDIPGYYSYFAYAVKPGYSGVALYTKTQPLQVTVGMGRDEFDREGRVLIAEYPDFLLVPTYFPSGSSGSVRQEYKLAFLEAYTEFLKTLTHKPVIICGDVNIAHKELDLARPKENMRSPGFTPEERAWVDRLLEMGYYDAFRLFNQAGGNYTWWHQVSAARQRNVGWRLDYFFVSQALKERVTNSQILHTIEGSDHCPVSLELDY